LYSPNKQGHEKCKFVVMSMDERQIELKIEGMDCANCALGITRKLNKGGHQQVQVNFATGEATLELAPETTRQQVVNDITSLGYRVVEPVAANARKPFRLSTEQKFWFCLVFTLPLFFGHMLFGHQALINQPRVQLALCLPVLAVGGFHFARSAWGSVRSGVANMDVLILLGSASAFGYSIFGWFTAASAHEIHNYLFFETTATIITLVLLGNVFEHRAVKRTTTAIDELAALQPSTARRITSHGNHEHIEEVPASVLRPGDLLQLNTGDAIPADASVTEGNGAANEAMMTGEAIPVSKQPGDSLTAGTILLQGPLRARVERTGKHTLLSKIIDLVKQAQHEKPPVQQLADKISAIFVPAVVLIALITLAVNFWLIDTGLREALLRSIAVLVISCPCAMGLATPTAVMVGAGRAARNGILLRGGRTLETLANVRTIVFDKTGTLTTGVFSEIHFTALPGHDAEQLQGILLALEQQSAHPLAKSVVSLLNRQGHAQPATLSELHEITGTGIEGRDALGNVWAAGSWRLLPENHHAGQHDIYLLCNGLPVAVADLRDELRPGMKELIDFIHGRGIHTVLLSGDRAEKCHEVATALGIKEVLAAQLPQQKLEHIARFTAQGTTAMVGDGINAHAGIAHGEATPAALQSAQVLLAGTADLRKLRDTLLISHHTLRTIRQNLFWAFFYNVIAIPMAAAGLLSPMVAALSMAFSDVIVIGNSIRLRTKKLS
jgi:P-type Cu+ transporter